MTSEYAKIQRLLEAKHAGRYAELENARATVREDFASQHGWRHTTKSFTVDQLRNGHHCQHWTDDLWPTDWPYYPIDHPDYFRVAARPWFPVAIVSHEYGAFEDSQAYAKANGLIATLLPMSWYSPEQAIAVLYTSPLIPLA